MKNGYSSMKRRILAVIMSLVMIFQMLPAGALADGRFVTSEPMRVSDGTWTITFKDGDKEESCSVPFGSAIGSVAPTPETPDGQIFIGWYCGDVEFSSELVPDEPMTFTARYGYKVTFDPNTEADGQLAAIEIVVPVGETIGSQLPEVPEVPGYNTKWVKEGTELEVTADTEVTESFTAVVGKEKIIYTVTFVQEDGTAGTRETSVDDGFAVNDLPEVTPKTNKIGKWVYPGTTDEFTVGTVISEDLTVNAYYEQNIFTVNFMVDGAQFEQMTTATGTTIILPSDPIKAGATFLGWFTEENGQGTEYTAESIVSEDLTLYAYFDNQVRVSFIVKDENGNTISEKSQYFVDLTVGDQITTLPDNPFVEGKVFDHWENENDHEIVDVGYAVTESFNAVAVFNTYDTYEVTIHYFYMVGERRVSIGSQVFNINKEDLIKEEPYKISVPGYTIADEVENDPTYYPKEPTITITLDLFGENSKTYVTEDEFVPADARYKVGHYLKNLLGNGYTLIGDWENKVGVKNSKVTPDINSYSYADYESRDTDITITGNTNQELKVYYTRKDFTLSYNVGAGDYINAVTKPYGTEITLPTTATRSGYTFGGWYKDEACTNNQKVTGKYTLNANTTLYAKWNAAQSEYKIVYMIENANDDGYSYLATVTKTAPTDSSVTMTAQTAGANGNRPSELDTTNFTFKESTTETIKADGTTVVTVSYSRNKYKLVSQSGGYSAEVEAKYGADITTAWDKQFNKYAGSWSFDNQNNSKFKSLTIMPSLSVRKNNSPANTIHVYHHDDNASYYQHLEYWLQNYTNGKRTTTHNGKTYGLIKEIDMRYNYLSDVDDWYTITGYTKAGYTATHSSHENSGFTNFENGEYEWEKRFDEYEGYYDWWGGYHRNNSDYKYTRFNFYYDAAKYELSFYNYDGVLISTQDVKDFTECLQTAPSSCH